MFLDHKARNFSLTHSTFLIPGLVYHEAFAFMGSYKSDQRET